MAQPRIAKKVGRTLLEKRRIKREKRAAQASAQRKRDRLQTSATGS